MMNGQMFQIASIVATSKKALQLSEPIRFSQLEYENKIEFVFLPQKKFLRTEKYTVSNVSLWFEQIKKNGIQDIKLLCPYSVKDRQFLGFQQPFCPLHSSFHQIFLKCHMKCVFKYPSKIYRI